MNLPNLPVNNIIEQLQERAKELHTLYKVHELINQPEQYRFQEYFNQFRVAILPLISVYWFVSWRLTRSRLYGWLAFIAKK